MARGGIYDKETGKELEWPDRLIDKDMDSEALAYALGNLLNILLDRDVITAQDAIETIPGADRWFTHISPAKPKEVFDELEILRRLEGGDSIAYSTDGENAWFCKGNRAWVNEGAIISMRDKGLLLRSGPDEDGWSGTDTISDKGRSFLAKPPFILSPLVVCAG